MNWTSFSYRCLALTLLVAGMLMLNDSEPDLYRGIMCGLGGWQLGTWVGDWARKKWPL